MNIVLLVHYMLIIRVTLQIICYIRANVGFLNYHCLLLIIRSIMCPPMNAYKGCKLQITSQYNIISSLWTTIWYLLISQSQVPDTWAWCHQSVTKTWFNNFITELKCYFINCSRHRIETNLLFLIKKRNHCLDRSCDTDMGIFKIKQYLYNGSDMNQRFKFL